MPEEEGEAWVDAMGVRWFVEFKLLPAKKRRVRERVVGGPEGTKENTLGCVREAAPGEGA
jgi:hypothetical protein